MDKTDTKPKKRKVATPDKKAVGGVVKKKSRSEKRLIPEPPSVPPGFDALNVYQDYFKKFHEDGYVVIPNIVSVVECDFTVDRIWEWLSKYDSNIKRDDPTSWVNHFPYCMGPKGIIQWYSVGQEQFVWDIRQNPNVHRVFAELWQDEDLLVSFDAINIQIPPQITGKYAEEFGTSFQHSDQSPVRFSPHFLSFILMRSPNVLLIFIEKNRFSLCTRLCESQKYYGIRWLPCCSSQIPLSSPGNVQRVQTG